MVDGQIPDFIKDLEDATKSKRNYNVSSDLKIVNMKSAKNWGKAIIVPIDGENHGEGAIKQLNRVGRVEKWVSGTKKDGTEYGFVQRMYFFMDPKYYGELTDEQMKQLDRIKSKFSQVQNIPNVQGVGVHQLTLIQGLILKHTDRSNPVKTVNEGVPALCIYESKNFEKSFRNKINSMTDTLGSYSWLVELCNRSIQRKRYLEIEFYLNKEEGAGFQSSVSVGKFDEDAVKLTGGKIGLDLNDFKDGDKELIDKFHDPIKTWLGIPQEGNRYDNDYMNDIEVILNNKLRGEDTVETRTPSKQGEPDKPDSNSNFVAQDEKPVTEIPTAVETPKVEDPDDLPF